MPPTGTPAPAAATGTIRARRWEGADLKYAVPAWAPPPLYPPTPSTRAHSLLLHHLSREPKRRLLSHFITQELGVQGNSLEATQLDLETQCRPESHAGNSGFEPHRLPVLEEPPPEGLVIWPRSVWELVPQTVRFLRVTGPLTVGGDTLPVFIAFVLFSSKS